MRSSQLLIHSLFLGLCAAVLTCLISFSPASVFTFFSTSFAYLFLRKNLLTAPPFSFYFWLVVLGSLSAGAFSALSDDQKETAIYAGIATLAYALPGRFGLRRILLLKPLIIGLSWALMTIGIAADQSIFSLPNDHSVFKIFIEVLMLTTLLSTLYDMRDFNLKLPGEKTFVSVFGLSRFKVIYISLTILSIVFAIFLSQNTFRLSYFVSAIFGIMMLFFIENKKRYISTTWVIDSTFLLYFFLEKLSLEYYI